MKRCALEGCTEPAVGPQVLCLEHYNQSRAEHEARRRERAARETDTNICLDPCPRCHVPLLDRQRATHACEPPLRAIDFLRQAEAPIL